MNQKDTRILWGEFLLLGLLCLDGTPMAFGESSG